MSGKIITEGKFKKGGVNPPPVSERPRPPSGQGGPAPLSPAVVRLREENDGLKSMIAELRARISAVVVHVRRGEHPSRDLLTDVLAILEGDGHCERCGTPGRRHWCACSEGDK